MQLTFKTTVAAYRALLAEKPGNVLLQDENNVAFFQGGNIVGCTFQDGVVAGDVYDFDSAAFDDDEGCWAGAGEATREFIENPRYLLPQDIGLSLASLLDGKQS